MNKRIKTDFFEAQDEQGNIFEITEWTDFIDVGRGQTVPGLKSLTAFYRDANMTINSPVNVIDISQGKYELLHPKRILNKI